MQTRVNTSLDLETRNLRRFWEGLEGDIRIICPILDFHKVKCLLRQKPEWENNDELLDVAAECVQFLQRDGRLVYRDDMFPAIWIYTILDRLYDGLEDITLQFDANILDPTGELSPESRNSNLVLIGGPVGNKVTRKFLLETKPTPIQKFLFESAEQEDGRKLWEIGGRISKRGDGDCLVSDLALLAKKPSPWNPKRKVIVMAGISGFGTQAAGAAACSTQIADEFALYAQEKLVDWDTYELVVKITGSPALKSAQILAGSPRENIVKVIEPFESCEVLNDTAPMEACTKVATLRGLRSVALDRSRVDAALSASGIVGGILLIITSALIDSPVFAVAGSALIALACIHLLPEKKWTKTTES